MRFAIISDIQGNMAALEAVWADIETQSVEAVYCAGDLVGYGGSPNKVIDFIQSKEVTSVMGDFDEIVGFDLSARDHYHPEGRLEDAGIKALRWNKGQVGPGQKRYLRSLPLQWRAKPSDVSFLLVHGSPRSAKEYLYPDSPEATFVEAAKFAGSDLIIFGHTGQAYAKQVGGIWFLNAGSVGGHPGAAPRAQYWLVELGARPDFELRTINYLPAEEDFSTYLSSATDNLAAGSKGKPRPVTVSPPSVALRKGKV